VSVAHSLRHPPLIILIPFPLNSALLYPWLSNRFAPSLPQFASLEVVSFARSVFAACPVRVRLLRFRLAARARVRFEFTSVSVALKTGVALALLNHSCSVALALLNHSCSVVLALLDH
jgi:hypothetical protein